MAPEESSKGTYTLLGAAGAIGNSIANTLRERNIPYRVVGRNPDSLKASFGGDPLAQIKTWNPDDAASVREAVRGSQTLIYLVGVPYNQFQLHPLLMQRTLDAAIAESVERIVLIGTVYPYGRALANPIKEDHPRQPHTFKGQMRKAQEDLLLEADAAGKLRGSVLRLPDFYGTVGEKSLLHFLFQAAVNGGTANMIGPIDRPHEFIYVPDVGPVIANLAGRSEAYGRWWNLAGAGPITQREIIDQVSRLAGHPVKIRVLGKTALRVAGLFNPLIKEMVEMNYLLSEPLLMDDSALHALLGPIRKTSYDEGVQKTLTAYQSARR